MHAATIGDRALSARLLDHHGQRLTDRPLTLVEGACELTLPLGSLGPGDSVIELSAKATADAAQQYVCVLRHAIADMQPQRNEPVGRS